VNDTEREREMIHRRKTALAIGSRVRESRSSTRRKKPRRALSLHAGSKPTLAFTCYPPVAVPKPDAHLRTTQSGSRPPRPAIVARPWGGGRAPAPPPQTPHQVRRPSTETLYEGPPRGPPTRTQARTTSWRVPKQHRSVLKTRTLGYVLPAPTPMGRRLEHIIPHLEHLECSR